MKKVPGKDWTWNDKGYCHDGVHTFEGKLVWYTHYGNPHAGGGACEQSFEDFLRKGAPLYSVPGTVINELRSFLLEHLYKKPQNIPPESLSFNRGKLPPDVFFKKPIKILSFTMGYDAEYEFEVSFYDNAIRWYLQFDKQWSDPDRESIQYIDDFLEHGPPSGFELLANDDDLKSIALTIKKGINHVV